MTITYSLQSGSLPPGLTLMSDGSIGSLVPYDSSIAPIWHTNSGSIGNGTEGQAFSYSSFSVDAQPGNVIDKFSIVNYDRNDHSLPWGLTIDPALGTISGTLAELLDRNSSPWLPSEQPTWNTSSGALASTNELSTYTVSVSASATLGTSITKYHINNGYLPWGLTINSSGTISGTVAESLTRQPGDPNLVSPKPIWQVAPGSIGFVNEFDSFSFTLNATPQLGNSISTYNVISGWLPWGLLINKTTGIISGTTAEIAANAGSQFMVGSGPTYTTSSNLGSTALSSSFNQTISATPMSGRTVVGYYISSSGLPWGLTLNYTTGVLSGTIDNTLNSVKTYTFSVTVLDSARAITTQTFSITITS